jgi:hypothetical protein
MKAVLRAQADVEAGRLWKARDRLQGALRSEPANQELLQMLGEVCFAMSDSPAASVYWFLTDAHGPDVDAAAAVRAERFPTPLSLLEALPVKAPLDAYPEEVTKRVRELAQAANRAAPYGSIKARRLGEQEPTRPAHRRLENLMVDLILLALVVPWVVGVAAVIFLVWKFL